MLLMLQTVLLACWFLYHKNREKFGIVNTKIECLLNLRRERVRNFNMNSRNEPLLNRNVQIIDQRYEIVFKFDTRRKTAEF
jgi:hypothetical protein